MDREDVYIYTKFNKATRTKGIRNILYHVPVAFFIKHNEDEY